MKKVLLREFVEGQDALEKVLLPLGDDQWHGFAEESVWAKRLNDNRFEIRNTPFFAKGLAYLDVVLAEPLDDLYVVIEVVTPSRHSTYRALVEGNATTPTIDEALRSLKSVGCTYETYRNSNWTLYAIDVPPNAVDSAYRVIRSTHEQGHWDFDEGHFGGRDH
jgi:hypothetical protein